MGHEDVGGVHIELSALGGEYCGVEKLCQIDIGCIKSASEIGCSANYRSINICSITS